MFATPVASSPLSVRNSNGSFKRAVSGGAARGSCPVALPGGLPSRLSYTEQDVPPMWMSTSATRRSVASSPHSMADQRGSSTVPAKPAQVLVGFEVASSSAFATSSCGPAVAEHPPARHQPACATGLLSRALSSQSPPLPPPTADISSRPRDYFPGVDTSLLSDLQERHAVFHTPLVVNAYMLAAHLYGGQLRKDGTTQLSHCVMTALQLADMNLDAETVSAGLLHEVLRQNPLARCHVEEFMPSTVVQLVDRVTTISEISSLYRHNKDSLGEENMRRMLLAMEDLNAVLIKLACRVHNMKTISALPHDKQRVFAEETLEVFSVVANRLGMWSLKAELEDLAFSILHPEEYEALSAQVAKRQDTEALEATINSIRASLDERGVKYEDISGRPKNLYGIWVKMKADNITSLDQVYDVTALRVVVTNKHDCYVALRCIQELYRCMPGRSKDYITKTKKPNGYQSLHETIVGEADLPMEVQIRTHKMHYIAEYGFAAHWKYKEKLSNEDEWLDKEVQYKKWLTTYKLGLHDKKVRAAGAPPRETALHSLGMHLIDGRGASSDPRVDPFLRHDRFKLQAPAKQRVSVVVQTQDSIDYRDFPLGYSSSRLAAELHMEQLPGYVMTVNKRVPTKDVVLQNGDLVQVVLQEDASPAASPPMPSPLFSPASPTPLPSVFQQQKQPALSALYTPQPVLFGSLPRGELGSQRPPLPSRPSFRQRLSAECPSSGTMERPRAPVPALNLSPICT